MSAVAISGKADFTRTLPLPLSCALLHTRASEVLNGDLVGPMPVESVSRTVLCSWTCGRGIPSERNFGHTYKGREVGRDDTERSREVIKTLTFDNAKDLGEN